MDDFLLELDLERIGVGIKETLYMVSWSVVLTILIGIPLGVLLFLTSRGDRIKNRFASRLLRVLNMILGWIVQIGVMVNILRSIPFVILIILMFPITKLLIGTTIGTSAAIPALVVGTAPFFARIVETALREVDRGVIEAAESIGANRLTIIWKVLLPESMPAIVSGITITSVALVGYTAIAGIVGAGGLGYLAYRFGFQAFNEPMMFTITVIIILMVQVIQMIGDYAVKRIDKRT